MVLASANVGKLAEFRQLFSSMDFQVLPQSEFAIDDVEETGLTFVENALIKARHAARISGLPALADDSGLCVDALGGAPGLYSARYAGVHGNDAANMQKLVHALRDVPDERRTARFVCVLALLRHADDPQPLIAQGTWEGRILSAPRGEGGFGYDPLFLVPGLNQSAAELAAADKHRLSHRGQAMVELHKMLQQE